MDDIFVGNLMSAPVETVAPETPVQKAAGVLLDNDIGSVVVVDGDNRPAGIFTKTDCVRIVADYDAIPDSPVSEYMSTVLTTTSADRTIRDAADVMLDHGVHHLPVVDDEDGVIGMLTTTDLTAYLSHVHSPSPDA